MRVKVNYFFFILTIVAPLTGALLALPYGLFIASTPYYFSWPFGSFWQEFFAITIVIIFLFLLLIAYMAMPWLVVIKGDRIVFHRLFRHKLVVDLKGIERIELHGNIEAGNRKGYHISFIRKDNGERIIAMGLSYGMTKLVLEHLKDRGIEVTRYAGGITKEEWKQHVRRGY